MIARYSFDKVSRSELENILREIEERDTVRWVLYVRRGPPQRVERRDGLVVEVVGGTGGPTAPYSGHIFCYGRSDPDRCYEESALRLEVEQRGSFNVVSTVARAMPVEKAIASAFMT